MLDLSLVREGCFLKNKKLRINKKQEHILFRNERTGMFLGLGPSKQGTKFLFHQECLIYAARAVGEATRECVKQLSDIPKVVRKRMRREVDTWHSGGC